MNRQNAECLLSMLCCPSRKANAKRLKNKGDCYKQNLLKYKIHMNDKLAVEQVNFEEQLGKNNNCIMKQEVCQSTGKMECMTGV